MLAQGFEPQPCPLKCTAGADHNRLNVPPQFAHLGTCESTANTSSTTKLHSLHSKSYLGMMI